MKTILLAVLLISPLATLPAAVIYSGSHNLSVNWDDLEGIYINMDGGAVVNAYPANFDEAPWINITLGGYGIFNSEILRPWATSAGAYDPDLETDYYQNLAAGTVLDNSSPFVVNGWASTHHMGNVGDPDKFILTETGYLGFQFENEVGGASHYGWLRFTPNSDSAGTIIDWAYSDTSGESIQVGAVPEPSTAVLLLSMISGTTIRRRRA
jgi:hypothetical protein